MNINSQLKIFPNPSPGRISIELPKFTESFVTINVYNTIGQLIHTHSNTSNTPLLTLDLSNLAPGTYWLELSTSKEQFVEQVIIY